MDCRFYLTICIFIYFGSGAQSKVDNIKGILCIRHEHRTHKLNFLGSEILSKTSVANALPDDEGKAIDTSINEVLSQDVKVTYPFMVSIQRNDAGKYTHLCGGSILSKNFVLTAAHCALKPRQLFPKDLSVVAGSTKLFDKNATRFRVKAMKNILISYHLGGMTYFFCKWILKYQLIMFDLTQSIIGIRPGKWDHCILSYLAGATQNQISQKIWK